MNILFERGGVTPILMPYYKFKKHKVEMDFGGFLQEIIYGLLCKKSIIYEENSICIVRMFDHLSKL